MIIKIYCDLSFAIIETETARESISVSDNGSIHYAFNSRDYAVEKIYNTLDDFKMDGDRSETSIWLAVGVCGMPLDTKKKAQALALAPVV